MDIANGLQRVISATDKRTAGTAATINLPPCHPSTDTDDDEREDEYRNGLERD